MFVVCQNCGRRTFKGEEFCPKCGSPMPKERTSYEEENDLSSRFKKFSTADQNSAEVPQFDASEHPPYAPAPVESPVYNPAEQPPSPSEEVPPSVFVPEIEFKPVNNPTADPQACGSLHNDDQGFYGSYGAICNDSVKNTQSTSTEPQSDFMQEEFKPVFSTDVPDYLNSFSSSDFTLPSSKDDEDAPFNPVIQDTDDDDDDLVIPDFSGRFDNESVNAEKSKSIGYEATVPLKDAQKADRNQKPINEPIPDVVPKPHIFPKRVKEYTAVASGTVNGKRELPPLREGEMYVAVTAKEYRQLCGRKFRGLGILFTLCLVIISSFCIWSYANSFADPIVGRWKGDISSQDIPVDVIQQMNQDVINSTWEFSDGGSLYLGLVINDTPVNLSGTYKKQQDENGNQYVTMILNNPMDGSDYSLNMYYTVTGKVLEFNDMEGLGITMYLTKE